MHGKVSESNRDRQLKRGRIRLLRPRKFGLPILAGSDSCMHPHTDERDRGVLVEVRKAVTRPSFISNKVVMDKVVRTLLEAFLAEGSCDSVRLSSLASALPPTVSLTRGGHGQCQAASILLW